MGDASILQLNPQDLDILNGLSTPASERHTILQLAGVGHKENYLSNVYAYFLNPMGDHQLGQLFLDALYDVIQGDNPFVQSDSVEVMREVRAEDGKRIDLVVRDKTHCLIMESKVYANLTNDLLLYERYAELRELDRTCIVLSRHRHHNLPPSYKSVTHAEWVRRVEEKVMHSELEPEIEFTLNQFIRTIKQLTIPNSMEQTVNDYFTHASVIAKAVKTQEHAKRWIHGQIESYAGEKGWNTNSRNDRFRHIYPNQEIVYYTILLEPLWEGKQYFSVILEIAGAAKTVWETQEIASKNTAPLPPVGLSTHGGTTWRHTYFLHCEFPGSTNKGFTEILSQALSILEPGRKDILSLVKDEQASAKSV